MASRTPFRIAQFPFILARSPRLLVKRSKPSSPEKILVIHNLLLGDTLMVTSLLAKLREKFPDAEIFHAMPESLVPLYKGRPYGVKAVSFNPFKNSSFFDLLKLPKIDWAFVPGDNRYGWTAFALGAKWITGFAGDRPAYKNWFFDELIPYSKTPQTLTDMMANLVEGPDPQPFSHDNWPAPSFESFPMPAKPYALLHVGVRSQLKAWPSAKWKALITEIKHKGLKIVLSCGPGEIHLLEPLKSNLDFSYPGNLKLSQLWPLIKKANLLICPDNGIAHMGKIIGTPTVCLFGPGSADLFGQGNFWSKSKYEAVMKPINCRNQHNVFKRSISWVETCERFQYQCSNHKCMELIEVKDVLDAIERVISK
jgi:ADP-heptose:LPS heptosyltransferase